MATLLLVDDNQAFLDMYGMLLEIIGFDIARAGGKEECMRTLQSVQPDLVLLDIMMEPLDGWDTLQSIRRNSQTKDLPVVILTGKRPTVEEIDRYGRDIEDYIIKPVRKSEMKEILERVLGKIRQRIADTEAARKRGSDTADEIAEYVRVMRAVEMDEKFRTLFVEINDEQEEQVRQRRKLFDVLKGHLNIS